MLCPPSSENALLFFAVPKHVESACAALRFRTSIATQLGQVKKKHSHCLIILIHIIVHNFIIINVFYERPGYQNQAFHSISSSIIIAIANINISLKTLDDIHYSLSILRYIPNQTESFISDSIQIHIIISASVVFLAQ